MPLSPGDRSAASRCFGAVLPSRPSSAAQWQRCERKVFQSCACLIRVLIKVAGALPGAFALISPCRTRIAHCKSSYRKSLASPSVVFTRSRMVLDTGRLSNGSAIFKVFTFERISGVSARVRSRCGPMRAETLISVTIMPRSADWSERSAPLRAEPLDAAMISFTLSFHREESARSPPHLMEATRESGGGRPTQEIQMWLCSHRGSIFATIFAR